MKPFLTTADVEAELKRQTGIDVTHAIFHKWLGAEYDTGSLDAVLAVAACDRLGGDPPWLLLVSGSGNAKTETVGALAGMGAFITSTVTSEGALLSATPTKDKANGATGGLLRKIGDSGVLVIKDFTSILSMNRDLRSSVLAALREVYDGRWERNVGVDGGKTLTWEGRIVLVGAVTTAYDSAHGVISAMGDRFALVRVDSTIGRLAAGRQALSNVNHETQMRAQLSAAVRELMDHNLHPERAELNDGDMDVLLAVADLVTFARTAVERDYQGNVIDAHAPEMPTRFAKMLGQVMRGGLAIGMDHDRALQTAVRVAGDSMPPLRLAILADLMEHQYSTTTDVRKRLQRPHNTIDRELQALHLLGLLEQHQEEGRQGWRYVLSDLVEPASLKALVSRNVSTQDVEIRSKAALVPDKPGNGVSRKVTTHDVGIQKSALVPDKSGNGVSRKVTTHDVGIQKSALVPDKSGNGSLANQDEPAGDYLDAPLWPNAADVCPGCHWPYDSAGHQNNCEGA